jgi:hypothetical protein
LRAACRWPGSKVQEVIMTEEFRDDLRPTESREAYSGRTQRRMNEPMFTGMDVAAFVVTLIMVCGPLAMGAFRLH